MALAYEQILLAISSHSQLVEGRGGAIAYASVARWNAATQRAIASTHPDGLLLPTTGKAESLANNVSKETGIRIRSWIS